VLSRALAASQPRLSCFPYNAAFAKFSTAEFSRLAPMPARTIAIGDIHGCSQALAALLEAIRPTPEDEIVTLGDYVDRGPDAAGVIERLLALAHQTRLAPLVGNHEAMMLAAIDRGGESARFWLACGGYETLDSYGGNISNIPPSHIDFLRGLRRYHATPRHIFLHANYDPQLEPPDQPDHLLLWQHLTLRPTPAHVSGKTIFVGHTPQISGRVLDLGHIVAIDTACVLGGWLTAIDADSRQIWQADMDGTLRDED
jgi:serine/threonine protein phosphatase 1